jgi:hypothetical protein
MREPSFTLAHCMANTDPEPSERSMSRKQRRKPRIESADPPADDLKDWAAIGMIVIASSFLVWVPFLA